MTPPECASPGTLATMIRPRPLLVLLAAVVVLSGCSGGGDAEPAPTESTASPSPTPTPTATPTEPPEPTTAEPEIGEIPDEQWDEIVDTGSWREGCPAGRDDLRLLEVNFVDFDDEVQRGALIANADTVPSLARIFERLFEMRFPIERMEPVEAFDGDTFESLKANNTSAYNCRRPDQINAPQARSPHANGRAIDINPDLNPWIDVRTGEWSPRATNSERSPGPGKILADDPVVELFEDEGWVWQNIDVPDYMHFDTGFPSVPWSSPND